MGKWLLKSLQSSGFFLLFFLFCRLWLRAAPGPRCGESTQTDSTVSALTCCQTADKTDHISKHFLRRGPADQTGSHWTAECEKRGEKWLWQLNPQAALLQLKNVKKKKKKSSMTKALNDTDVLITSLPLCVRVVCLSFKNDYFNTSYSVDKWQWLAINLKRARQRFHKDAGNVHETSDRWLKTQSSASIQWCSLRLWLAGLRLLSETEPPRNMKWHQMQTLQAKQLTTLTKCGIKREYGFK